jgi:hypothetical protein
MAQLVVTDCRWRSEDSNSEEIKENGIVHDPYFAILTSSGASSGDLPTTYLVIAAVVLVRRKSMRRPQVQVKAFTPLFFLDRKSQAADPVLIRLCEYTVSAFIAFAVLSGVG